MRVCVCNDSKFLISRGTYELGHGVRDGASGVAAPADPGGSIKGRWCKQTKARECVIANWRHAPTMFMVCEDFIETNARGRGVARYIPCRSFLMYAARFACSAQLHDPAPPKSDASSPKFSSVWHLIRAMKKLTNLNTVDRFGGLKDECPRTGYKSIRKDSPCGQPWG